MKLLIKIKRIHIQVSETQDNLIKHIFYYLIFITSESTSKLNWHLE